MLHRRHFSFFFLSPPPKPMIEPSLRCFRQRTGSLSSQSFFEKRSRNSFLVEPSAFTSGQKEAGSRFDWPWTSCLHSTRLGGDYAFFACYALASHGVSGSLTSSVYGDSASAADPASIVNQVQFAEIRSPMESTIGIKRIDGFFV